MTTPDILALIFVGACFLCAMVYIIMEEKEESDIFKNWKQ